MSQLIYIVRLCHVSAGEPGVFGTLVVRGLYTQALCKARDDADEGRPVAQIIIKKAEKVKSIAKNKAEDYLRVANRLYMVSSEVMGESAMEATASKLGSTNRDIQAKVNAGISAHASPTHALPCATGRMPSTVFCACSSRGWRPARCSITAWRSFCLVLRSRSAWPRRRGTLDRCTSWNVPRLA